MRISCNRSVNRKGLTAFTIMEMVVVMGVLTMIMSGTLVYFMGSDSEKAFRETADDIESLAREAQTRAIMTHNTYKIAFMGNRVGLFDHTQSTRDAQDFTQNTPKKEVKLTHDQMKYSIQRWGQTNWVIPTDSRPVVWVFSPEGFVEPISINFKIKDSYLQQVYHPLSASVIDEEMIIK